MPKLGIVSSGNDKRLAKPAGIAPAITRSSVFGLDPFAAAEEQIVQTAQNNRQRAVMPSRRDRAWRTSPRSLTSGNPLRRLRQ
ncbi:hypothetical protein ACLFKX_01825 [Enterobacter hormaechei]